MLFWPGRCTAPEPRPPNVVVIFTDDQGYADVEAYGAEGIATMSRSWRSVVLNAYGPRGTFPWWEIPLGPWMDQPVRCGERAMR
jgi:hypothetical protein